MLKEGMKYVEIKMSTASIDKSFSPKIPHMYLKLQLVAICTW